MDLFIPQTLACHVFGWPESKFCTLSCHYLKMGMHFLTFNCHTLSVFGIYSIYETFDKTAGSFYTISIRFDDHGHAILYIDRVSFLSSIREKGL